MKLFATILLTAILMCTAVFAVNAQASGDTVEVTMPEFGILINGEVVYNTYAKYPCIVYNGITYFPMTYNDSRALGLTADWSAEDGLVISKIADAVPCAPDFEEGDDGNANGTATIASGKITINGKAIDNSAEEYPVLLFRDITYFPLTWRFAVEEFGWSYRFTDRLGLEIALDAEDMKNIVPDNAPENACGDNLTWRFDEDTATLYIEGVGDMWDFVKWNKGYLFLVNRPWKENENAIKTVKIGDGVTSIGDEAFYRCTSLASITIPDSVTNIGDGAFSGCKSLASITIPDSVTSIGNRAFSGCKSLASITIPDSVTSIGDGAFYDCDSLTSITIPDSVTSIGDGAFESCDSLASITIPNSVTSIGDGAFYSCISLASITIPDSVTSIGDRAFSWCGSLTSITIPDSVTSIGNEAFYICTSLASIEVDSNNKNYCDIDGILLSKDQTIIICYPAGKRATNYTIPDSVTSIGYMAFSWCYSLASITIPDSVTSIGNEAFYRCESLASITIPDSVTSIGNQAFSWCYSLKEIHFLGTKEQWETLGLDAGDINNATVTFAK